MILYGSVSSPVAVQKYLTAKRDKSIHYLPIGSTVSGSHKIIFILHYEDLIHNLSKLNRMSTRVFVFADPFKLRQIVNINLIDFKPVSKYSGTISNISLPHAMPKRYYVKDTFIADLISITIRGSLLNMLMTWIYSLPKVNLQTTVKNAVVEWLFNGDGDYQIIYDRLRVISQIGGTKLDEGMKILTSKNIENYILAFNHIARTTTSYNAVDVDNVSKLFSVDTFELNYCIHIYRELINRSRDNEEPD